jgi:hypothetical protein
LGESAAESSEESLGLGPLLVGALLVVFGPVAVGSDTFRCSGSIVVAAITSLKVRRKSPSTFPAVRAISIDLLGPKTRKATKKITANSGIPMPRKFKSRPRAGRDIPADSWLPTRGIPAAARNIPIPPASPAAGIKAIQ